MADDELVQGFRRDVDRLLQSLNKGVRSTGATSRTATAAASGLRPITTSTNPGRSESQRSSAAAAAARRQQRVASKHEGHVKESLMTMRSRLIKRLSAKQMQQCFLQAGEAFLAADHLQVAEYCFLQARDAEDEAVAQAGTTQDSAAVEQHVALQFGLAQCRALRLQVSDPGLAAPISVQTLVSIVTDVRVACEAAAAHPELYWLVFNGSIVLHQHTTPLAWAGHPHLALEPRLYAATLLEGFPEMFQAKYLDWRTSLYLSVCDTYEQLSKWDEAIAYATHAKAQIMQVHQLETCPEARNVEASQEVCDSAVRCIDSALLRLRLRSNESAPDDVLQALDTARAQSVANSGAAEASNTATAQPASRKNTGASSKATSKAGRAAQQQAQAEAKQLEQLRLQQLQQQQQQQQDSSASGSQQDRLAHSLRDLLADQPVLRHVTWLRTPAAMLDFLHSVIAPTAVMRIVGEAPATTVTPLAEHITAAAAALLTWLQAQQRNVSVGASTPDGTEQQRQQQQAGEQVESELLNVPVATRLALIAAAFGQGCWTVFHAWSEAFLRDLRAPDTVPRPSAQRRVALLITELLLGVRRVWLANDATDAGIALCDLAQALSNVASVTSASQRGIIIAKHQDIVLDAALLLWKDSASIDALPLPQQVTAIQAVHDTLGFLDSADILLRLRVGLRLADRRSAQGAHTEAARVLAALIPSAHAACEPLIQRAPGLCVRASLRLDDAADTKAPSSTEELLAALTLLLIQVWLSLFQAELTHAHRHAQAAADAEYATLVAKRRAHQRAVPQVRVDLTAIESKLLRLCSKNLYLHTLMKLQLARYRDNPTDVRTTLEAAMQALDDVAEEEVQTAALMEQDAQAEAAAWRFAPPPPQLLWRTATAMCVRVVGANSGPDRVKGFAVYAKPVGSGTSVMMSSTEFPGTGQIMRKDVSTVFLVSGLEASQAYQFAVAAFDANEVAVGSISESTPPIPALLPMPVLLLRAYVAQAAQATGCSAVFLRAADAVFRPLIRTNSAAMDVTRHTPAAVYQLRPGRLLEAPRELRLVFVQLCFGAVDVLQEQIAAGGEPRQAGMQIKLLKNAQRLVIAMHVAAGLQRDALAEEAGVRCYNVLVPLLHMPAMDCFLLPLLLHLALTLHAVWKRSPRAQHDGSGGSDVGDSNGDDKPLPRSAAAALVRARVAAALQRIVHHLDYSTVAEAIHSAADATGVPRAHTHAAAVASMLSLTLPEVPSTATIGDTALRTARARGQLSAALKAIEAAAAGTAGGESPALPLADVAKTTARVCQAALSRRGGASEVIQAMEQVNTLLTACRVPRLWRPWMGEAAPPTAPGIVAVAPTAAAGAASRRGAGKDDKAAAGSGRKKTGGAGGVGKVGGGATSGGGSGKTTSAAAAAAASAAATGNDGDADADPQERAVRILQRYLPAMVKNKATREAWRCEAVWRGQIALAQAQAHIDTALALYEAHVPSKEQQRLAGVWRVLCSPDTAATAVLELGNALDTAPPRDADQPYVASVMQGAGHAARAVRLADSPPDLANASRLLLLAAQLTVPAPVTAAARGDVTLRLVASATRMASHWYNMQRHRSVIQELVVAASHAALLAGQFIPGIHLTLGFNDVSAGLHAPQLLPLTVLLYDSALAACNAPVLDSLAEGDEDGDVPPGASKSQLEDACSIEEVQVMLETALAERPSVAVSLATARQNALMYHSEALFAVPQHVEIARPSTPERGARRPSSAARRTSLAVRTTGGRRKSTALSPKPGSVSGGSGSIDGGSGKRQLSLSMRRQSEAQARRASTMRSSFAAQQRAGKAATRPSEAAVIAAYDRVLDVVRKRQDASLLAVSSRELGQFLVSVQLAPRAYDTWSQALDHLIGEYDVVASWYQLNLTPEKLLRRCGWWRCVLAGLLAGRMGQHAAASQREACFQLAAVLFAAPLASSLPHPRLPHQFADYTPMEVVPGAHIIDDAAGAWTAAELIVVLRATLAACVSSPAALPVAALLEHVARHVCGSAAETARARVLRGHALLALGYPAEAISCLDSVVSGRDMPRHAIAGVFATCGQAYGFAVASADATTTDTDGGIGVFNNAMDPMRGSNATVLRNVASLGDLSSDVRRLYGTDNVAELAEAAAFLRADVMLTLAKACAEAPRDIYDRAADSVGKSTPDPVIQAAVLTSAATQHAAGAPSPAAATSAAERPATARKTGSKRAGSAARTRAGSSGSSAATGTGSAAAEKSSKDTAAAAAEASSAAGSGEVGGNGGASANADASAAAAAAMRTMLLRSAERCLLDLGSSNSRAYVQLARVYHAQGSYARAVRFLTQALQYVSLPDEVSVMLEIHEALVRALIDARSYSVAADYLATALEDAAGLAIPRQVARLQYQQVRLLTLQGAPDAAEALARALVRDTAGSDTIARARLLCFLADRCDAPAAAATRADSNGDALDLLMQAEALVREAAHNDGFDERLPVHETNRYIKVLPLFAQVYVALAQHLLAAADGTASVHTAVQQATRAEFLLARAAAVPVHLSCAADLVLGQARRLHAAAAPVRDPGMLAGVQRPLRRAVYVAVAHGHDHDVLCAALTELALAHLEVDILHGGSTPVRDAPAAAHYVLQAGAVAEMAAALSGKSDAVWNAARVAASSSAASSTPVPPSAAWLGLEASAPSAAQRLWADQAQTGTPGASGPATPAGKRGGTAAAAGSAGAGASSAAGKAASRQSGRASAAAAEDVPELALPAPSALLTLILTLRMEQKAFRFDNDALHLQHQQVVAYARATLPAFAKHCLVSSAAELMHNGSAVPQVSAGAVSINMLAPVANFKASLVYVAGPRSVEPAAGDAAAATPAPRSRRNKGAVAAARNAGMSRAGSRAEIAAASSGAGASAATASTAAPAIVGVVVLGSGVEAAHAIGAALQAAGNKAPLLPSMRTPADSAVNDAAALMQRPPTDVSAAAPLAHVLRPAGWLHAPQGGLEAVHRMLRPS